MTGAPALLVDHARERHGDVQVLTDVSLVAEPGQWIALAGESGAGKSTLIRCINRLEELDAGRIALDGEDVRDRDPVLLRRSIGYVPQGGGLLGLVWRAVTSASLRHAAVQRGREVR